jgi:hypothetical protein
VILDVAAHQAAMALQQFRLLRQQAFRAIEHNFQQTVDNFPGMVHTMTAAGEAEFINHRILHYFGKTRAELNDWGSSCIPTTGRGSLIYGLARSRPVSRTMLNITCSVLTEPTVGFTHAVFP